MRRPEKGSLGLRLAFLLALGFGAGARADVIVAQPHSAACDGAFSNFVPGELLHQQIADDFSLSRTTTLESISWPGRYGAALNLTNPIALSVRFFLDAGGLPEVFPLAVFDIKVGASKNGLSFGGTPWFSYTAPLGLALDPGKYWVSVVERDPRTPGSGGSQWLWGHSGSLGSCSAGTFDVRAFRSSEGTGWSGQPGMNQAFTLTGTIRGQQPFQKVATVRADEVHALISSLEPGTRYVFRVQARNSAGSSGYSNQVGITTPR